MAKSYPDFSKPKNKDESDYPDFSKPKEKSQEPFLAKAGRFAEENISDPIMSAALGGVQGIANLPAGLANLPIKGINAATGSNIPEIPRFNVAPKNAAATAGDIGSMFMGPGLLRLGGEGLAAVKASMKNPMIERAIENARNIFNKSPVSAKTAGTIAGSSLLGGAYSPENTGLGMTAGAALPIAGKALNPLANIVKDAFNKVNPAEIGRSVQAAHDALKDSASNLYNTVSKEATKRGVDKVRIDKSLVDEMSRYLPKTRATLKLINEADKGDYSALRKAQSELWNRGTKKKASALASDRDAGEEMLDLRDRMNEIVDEHFKKTGNEDLSNLLDQANKKHYELKKTYYSHPTISKLVHKETREIPKNILGVLSKDSVPMERLRKANPLISKNIELAQNKKNALKKLKYLGLIGAAGVGGMGIGGLYNKAKQVGNMLTQ
jgi:hypothetical protein